MKYAIVKGTTKSHFMVYRGNYKPVATLLLTGTEVLVKDYPWLTAQDYRSIFHNDDDIHSFTDAVKKFALANNKQTIVIDVREEYIDKSTIDIWENEGFYQWDEDNFSYGKAVVPPVEVSETEYHVGTSNYETYKCVYYDGYIVGQLLPMGKDLLFTYQAIGDTKKLLNSKTILVEVLQGVHQFASANYYERLLVTRYNCDAGTIYPMEDWQALGFKKEGPGILYMYCNTME